MSSREHDTNIDNERPVESTVIIREYEIIPFGSERYQYLNLHEGAEILSKTTSSRRPGPVYGYRNKYSTIWAREDTSRPKVRRQIVFITIDEPIEPNEMGKYIDTVWDGDEVVHIFDCG
jgi:hypothetical protein